MKFLEIWKASVKSENSWIWTDTKTDATSTGTTQSISVTIGGPAFGYTGPTDMAAYYDQIYQTFAFAPVVAQPGTLRGVVMSRAGKPIAGQEVIASREASNTAPIRMSMASIASPANSSARSIFRSAPSASAYHE